MAFTLRSNDFNSCHSHCSSYYGTNLANKVAPIVPHQRLQIERRLRKFLSSIISFLTSEQIFLPLNLQ